MIDLKNKISTDIENAIRQLYGTEQKVELTIPDAQFGDFATNAALHLAKPLGKSPKEIAEQIVAALAKKNISAAVAGPGFINISVTSRELWDASKQRDVSVFSGRNFVVEYSCPNYFKELHAGHLYQTLYGHEYASKSG